MPVHKIKEPPMSNFYALRLASRTRSIKYICQVIMRHRYGGFSHSKICKQSLIAIQTYHLRPRLWQDVKPSLACNEHWHLCIIYDKSKALNRVGRIERYIRTP